jgi:hypothetical protein
MNKKNRPSYRQPQARPRQFRWAWLLVGLALVLVATGGLLLWRPIRQALRQAQEGPQGRPFQAEPDFVPQGGYARPEVTGAPQLTVDQTTVDAGMVKFETPVQAAFRLRNTGDKPLQILGEPQVELIEGC